MMVFRAKPVASATVVIPPQPRSEASVAAHCRRIRSSITCSSNLYLIRIRLIVALFFTQPLSSQPQLDATILLRLFFHGKMREHKRPANGSRTLPNAPRAALDRE